MISCLHFSFGVFMLLVMMACTAVSESSDLEEEEQKVHLIQAQEREHREMLEVGGTLLPKQELHILAISGGKVANLPFKEGEDFFRNDVVACIDNPLLELELGRAQKLMERSALALTLSEQGLKDLRAQLERRFLDWVCQAAEKDLAYMRVAEGKRRLNESIVLWQAGALSDEQLRILRYEQACLDEELDILHMALSKAAIGLRRTDLERAGLLTDFVFDIPCNDYLIPQDCLHSDLEQEDVFELFFLLHAQSLISERDMAIANFQMAEIALKEAEFNMQSLVIRAPFNGRVISRDCNVGSLVAAGSPIMHIISLDGLDVHVRISEKDAVYLKKGLEVELSVPATNFTGSGCVDLVFGMADIASASVSARISIDAPEEALRPGHFAKVFLPLHPDKKVVAVPRSSLRMLGDGRAQCFLFVAGRALEREVELGEELGDGLVIVSGISEEDLLIDCVPRLLKGGDPVEIISL